MNRRPRRVVPATVTALVVVALGVWLATAAVGSRLGQDPTRSLAPLGERLSVSPWSDPGVLAAAAVLGVLGVVLVVAALLPGRHVVVALDGGAGEDDRPGSAGITRRSLSRAVQQAAHDVDGVSSARATVSGRRVDVRAQSSLRDTAGLRERVEAAVGARLDDIPLSRRPRVQVRTTGSEERHLMGPISHRPGRLNRTVLLLLGLLCLAGGGAALAAASGLLADLVPADQPVLTGPAAAYLTERTWVPWAAAALGVLLALAGVRWLVTQLPRRTGPGRIALSGDGRRGTTRLDAATVADAVEADVQGYAGVRSAHAAVSGARTDPTLTLSLVLDPDSDVRALQQRIREHAETRLARALGAGSVSTRLLVSMGRAGGATTVR